MNLKNFAFSNDDSHSAQQWIWKVKKMQNIELKKIYVKLKMYENQENKRKFKFTEKVCYCKRS